MASQNELTDKIIEDLRELTRNVTLNDLSGNTVEPVTTKSLLRVLNEGKNLIQRAIANTYGGAFGAFETKQITSRSTTYPIPETALYGNRVIRLDYSLIDDPKRYYRLKKKDSQKIEYSEGDPVSYYIIGSNIVVEPAPSAGFYRFLIQRRADQMDVRRGTVESVAVVGTHLEIVLVEDSLLNSVNVAELGSAQYVCFCDFEGTVSVRNVPVLSYSSADRKIVTRDGYTADPGIAVGDYVTIGKYTTTHSELPSECLDYAFEYAMYRILNHQSDADKIESIPILQTLKATALEGWAENADLEEIPEHGFMLGDWFSDP